MIRHDYKIGKHIAIAIKVPQAFGHDMCQLSPAQHASAVPCIELVVPTLGEFTMELASQRDLECSKPRLPGRLIRIDSVGTQPAATVGTPVRQDRRRDGIIGSPGNKRDGTGLSPMRQPALRNEYARLALEQMHRKRLSHV